MDSFGAGGPVAAGGPVTVAGGPADVLGLAEVDAQSPVVPVLGAMPCDSGTLTGRAAANRRLTFVDFWKLRSPFSCNSALVDASNLIGCCC